MSTTQVTYLEKTALATKEIPGSDSQKTISNIANLPKIPAEEKVDIALAVKQSSKSIPKIIEATGFLTFGNLSYLIGGEKGFNSYLKISSALFNNVWGGGGAIFADQKSLANISDSQLNEVLNPLHHLGEVVTPILKPLHIISTKVTDSINFYGYNCYLASKGYPQGVNFQEYLERKNRKEHWELRVGENSLYALEALGIAYLMVTRGGILKALGGKPQSLTMLAKEGVDLVKLMRMPFFMSAMSSLGEVLQREEPDKAPIISLEVVSQLTSMIIRGTFDSVVFMGFISGISRTVVSTQTFRLNSAAKNELKLLQSSKLASETLEIPQSVLQLPQKIQKFAKSTELFAEGVDIAEGLPDFYNNSSNFKEKFLSLLSSPFRAQKWRAFSGAGLQLVSSALDLVDRRQSGESKRLLNVPDSIVQKQESKDINDILKDVGGGKISNGGRVLVLKDRQAVADFYQKRAEQLKLSIEENLFSYKGLKSLFVSPSTKLQDIFSLSGLKNSLKSFGSLEETKIRQSSEEIAAFYDTELGLTVIAEATTEIEKQRQLGYIFHEAVHNSISQIGLTAFLEKEVEFKRIIEEEMGIEITPLIGTKNGALQLEEMLAYIAEYQALATFGIEKFQNEGLEIIFLNDRDYYLSDYETIKEFVFDHYPNSMLDSEYSEVLLAAKRKKGLERRKHKRVPPQVIEEVHAVWGGKKPMKGVPFDFRIPIQTLSERSYHIQLSVEALFLEALGLEKTVVNGLMAKYRNKKQRWLRELLDYPHPIAVGWGGAAQSILEDPNANAIMDTIKLIADRLVAPERRCGMIHGSSTTGYMGCYDKAWASSGVWIYGEENYRNEFGIFTIPLNWTTDEIREIPAKSGQASHRCPPHVFLLLRTMDFLIRKPAFIMASPGGMGTNFEVSFIMLEWQLRKLLQTVCSSWTSATPVYLMDYQMSPFILDQRIETIAKENERRQTELLQALTQSSSWFYEGLRQHFITQILSGACSLSNTENIKILRVGEGENIEHGPKVLYFPDSTAIAEFVRENYDRDVAAQPELRSGRQ